MKNITDVKGYETFIKVEPVEKGWSSDQKYYIETADARCLLLRISAISEYERKQAEFKMVERAFGLDIPMSEPLDFGICDNGKSVYSLLTWCDGEDAETVLPLLNEMEQYKLGVRSGEILKKIHSIPAPEEQKSWADRFNRKIDTKIEKYRECGLVFAGDDKLMAYIEANRGLLDDRPQCYQHGDYHVGNMIISSGGKLSVIDFNRPDFGDPWEEFNRIVWSASVSPYFATGQLEGYFGGRPPMEFFRLLALYIGSNTLSAVYWAIPFGQDQVDIMMGQARDVLAWFGDMQTPVPSWYLEKLKFIKQ